MNRRSHAGQAATNDRHVHPGLRNLHPGRLREIVSGCLMDDFDPFNEPRQAVIDSGAIFSEGKEREQAPFGGQPPPPFDGGGPRGMALPCDCDSYGRYDGYYG